MPPDLHCLSKLPIIEESTLVSSRAPDSVCEGEGEDFQDGRSVIVSQTTVDAENVNLNVDSTQLETQTSNGTAMRRPGPAGTWLNDHAYCKIDHERKQLPLTPRKKALQKIIACQRVNICRLRKRLTFRASRKQVFNSATVSDERLNKHPMMRFFMSQITLHTRNKYGRRYAVQDKNFALSLYYASPKAYRLCSKMFCLPSVSMLRLWLRRMDVKPGLCDNVFIMLQRKAGNMAASERCCVLLLDEVSLKRGLSYVKPTDHIVGFEDYGGERTKKVANQALVLMVRGLQSRWKQPLAYFLAANTTPAERLKRIVSEAVVKLSSIGLIVVSVICDQGATNQQMFRMFGVTADEPCVNVEGHRIFFMFDPPHLLKSVRNNLMKHNFDVRGKQVAWKYIVGFYEADRKQTVKLAPKLSQRHINLPPFANMRVRLAAQVLSHSVAAGIYTHVSLGAMPAEAAFTAEFIDKIDSLFDCFNAGNFGGTKQYRRPLTDSSKHWHHVEECKEMLSSLKIVGSKAKVPCIQGFILSINSLTRLYQELREKYGFKFLLSNRLNQDALENHFSIIRSRGGFRDNPNPLAFNATFKQVMVQHLLDTPKDANCKDDLTTFMLSLQDLSPGARLQEIPLNMTAETAVLASDDTNVDHNALSADTLNELCDGNACELNAVSYVAGYIAKVVLASHKCQQCRAILLKVDQVTRESSNMFLDFKLYDGCRKDSLLTPSEFAIRIFCECRLVFTTHFNELMFGSRVICKLCELCTERVRDIPGFLQDKETCVTETINKSVALFIRVLLYHKVKVLNREMSAPKTEDKPQKRNRKALRVMHE